MLEGIIDYLETQLSVLNIFSMMGLCEQLTDGDRKYPAKYQSSGNLSQASDFDFHNASLYFRLLDRREGDPEDGQVGGDTYRTIIYNLRMVGIAPKDFYGTDNEYIDDKIISNICGLLADQSPTLLIQSLKAARIKINVSQTEMKRDVVLEQEFQKTDFETIPYEKVFFSIDFTVSVTGNADCFHIYGCSDEQTDFLELFRDKYCLTPDPATVRNENSTYTREVASGATLVLGSVIYTDSDGSEKSTLYNDTGDPILTCAPALSLLQQLNANSAATINTALHSTTGTKQTDVRSAVLTTDMGDGWLIGKYFNLANQPKGIVFNQAGDRVYVACGANNTVYILNPDTGAIITTVTGFSTPCKIMFTPDYSQYWVINDNSGANTIRVMRTSDNTQVRLIAAASLPARVFSLTFNPGGTLYYVGGLVSGTVEKRNITTDALVSTVTGFSTSGLYSLEFNADGTEWWAGQYVGIRKMSTASDTQIGSVITINSLTAFRFSADKSHYYVFRELYPTAVASDIQYYTAAGALAGTIKSPGIQCTQMAERTGLTAPMLYVPSFRDNVIFKAIN